MNLRSGKSIENNKTSYLMTTLSNLTEKCIVTNIDDRIESVIELQNFILNNIFDIKNSDYSLYCSIRNTCNNLIKDCQNVLINHENTYDNINNNNLLKLHLLLNIVKSKLKLN